MRIGAQIRNTSTADGATAVVVAPTIRMREDLDGCGCLDCRNVETITLRRTVLDALVWSVGLFRSRPSIVVFGIGVVLFNRLLESGVVAALPTPAVGALDAAGAFVFVFLLRAYVATIVAGALTDSSVTVRDAARRSLARVPALVALIALLVFVVMTVSSLASIPLFVLFALLSTNPVEVVGFPAVAAVGGVVFAVPFLVLLFRFWFAPEACVIGRYGPVESLRVSWRMTTNYPTRLLLVLLIAAGSAISLYLPGSLPAVVGGLSPALPLVDAVAASLGELLSVVWAGAYAHLYVQGAIE
jgi:hypothetical protein